MGVWCDPLRESAQRQTIGEWDCGSFSFNEPFARLLEYTITGQSAPIENSIEAGFGGVCSPTTIKDANESITHLGNLVAIK
jgi:hypothetical protein